MVSVARSVVRKYCIYRLVRVARHVVFIDILCYVV